MLDSDFKDVVTLRAPRKGSRRNASHVDWDPVLEDGSNALLRISCRFKRSGSKNFSTSSVEEISDATMLFQKTPGIDVSRENLVVDDRGDAYKVLRFREEDDLELGTTYKQVELKLTDMTFPEDVEDVR